MGPAGEGWRVPAPLLEPVHLERHPLAGQFLWPNLVQISALGADTDRTGIYMRYLRLELMVKYGTY